YYYTHSLHDALPISKRSIKASRFPGWRVYCLSSTIGQQYCAERLVACSVIAFSFGSGSDAWANVYRQPVAVRTYTSLNHSLYSNGLPSSMPFAQSKAVTTAVSPHT